MKHLSVANLARYQLVFSGWNPKNQFDEKICIADREFYTARGPKRAYIYVSDSSRLSANCESQGNNILATTHFEIEHGMSELDIKSGIFRFSKEVEAKIDASYARRPTLQS